MRLTISTIAAGLALTTAAVAQTGTANVTLDDTIKSDIEAALTAVEAKDFRGAALHLNTAAENASRIELQRIAQNLAARAPLFDTEDVRFALTNSATLTFEEFLRDRSTLERRFKDNKGRVVTVRIFGEERDMKEFVAIADDSAMLRKEGLELVEMAGAPAIKNRNDGLSVLMMSETDHALVEVTGDDEDAVMAFIEQLESAEE